jgi:hypothetical protein
LKRGALIPILLVCARLFGQDMIAPDTTSQTITTDSIDLFSVSRVPENSAKTALAATLVLPGSGHHRLGRNRSALGYISVDAASIFAFFVCTHYADKLAQDAAGYAWIHSGAQGEIKDADDYYWKLVGNFMDVNEYNEVMDLNRTPEDRITNEALVWRWDDESSKKHFNDMRTHSRGYRIASSFFLGALVLNRVVAFIELRTFSRSSSIKRGKLGSLHLNPSFAGSPNSIEGSLSGTF